MSDFWLVRHFVYYNNKFPKSSKARSAFFEIPGHLTLIFRYIRTHTFFYLFPYTVSHIM